jgi:glycosyltransferase involved in cell wall biosynthesis
MLKGYQGWAGRALAGLRALERCADILKSYKVVIYSANDDVRLVAELFTDATGVPIQIVPNGTPHREILALHGAARVSIGLSISDAVSTSLLEAMTMGSFPVQSWTSCADEWIKNGETGFLVPPEDPEVIESAIRKALQDDQLVDDAAARNWQTISERLDGTAIAEQVYKMYCSVMGEQVGKCLQDSPV